MSNSSSQSFNSSQSAVNGNSIGRDFNHNGDINQQQIINLLSDNYVSIEVIQAEYQRKIEDLEDAYKADLRAELQYLCIDVIDYRSKTFQAAQEKPIGLEATIKDDPINNLFFGSGLRQVEDKVEKGESSTLEELFLVGFRVYDKHQERNAEKRVENRRNDVGILDALIASLKQLLNINTLRVGVDRILDDTLLDKLSEETRNDVRSLKEKYVAKRDELEQKFDFEKSSYEAERKIKIYGHELKQCLKRDGYPLKPASLNLLEVCLREIELSKKGAERIEEKLIEPCCRESLQKYMQVYAAKLREGFPFSPDVSDEISELKKKLGLEDFNFLHLATKLIEEKLVEPFYRENIKKYEQTYRQKLKQEGFPLNPTTISELVVLEQNLCLGSFQFQDCPEPVTIRRQLIEPIYQTNLQGYSKAYRQNLYQFGVNFSQHNTIELEKLRATFGLNVSYLEKLGLQDLFNLEEIRKIEAEQEEEVYREHIQSFELEYMRKLDKEGFSLSYSTISELTHLEEVLGLGRFQFQDCPEPAVIKEKLLKPYYQVNLQNYSKEFKKNLYQFGLSLAESNASEVEKLRDNFGLSSAHLKNLGLQEQFTLENDLFAVEKTAKNLFYEESLQCYAQEFSRAVEIDSCLAEQSNTVKESIQALGIRREDIKVVEGLIKNNWSIEHLFHERDSEVSYWKLISFLAAHEWQKADILTRNLLLKLVDRSDKGFLDKGSVEKISAKDVYTLDRLWVEYSNGLFGFSVQKKILDRVEQKKQPFAEAVGWSNQAGLFKGIFAWKSYSELDFTLNAPKGHLPIWRVKGKDISVDDFSHLKIWDFKRNEFEPEEASITEDSSLIVSDTDNSKSNSSTTNILSQSFQKIFESINQFEIKKKVDKMGIDGFINQCAMLAATTGAASGFGGFTTMIVGVPFDVLNNVLQQFRVTLGVIYYKKGVYKVSFAELITIVGVSIGVKVGATLTKSVMISIANKILVQLSASTAGKAVPFLGAAIGGSVNYGFVKAIGAAVKRIDMSSYTFQSEGSGGEIKGQ